MRLSNKKRKLAYIREKNFYRTGGFAKGAFQMSNELRDELRSDTAVNMAFVELCSEDLLENLETKFKMDFVLVSFETSTCQDDFINDTTTVKVTLKRSNYPCKPKQITPR